MKCTIAPMSSVSQIIQRLNYRKKLDAQSSCWSLMNERARGTFFKKRRSNMASLKCLPWDAVLAVLPVTFDGAGMKDCLFFTFISLFVWFGKWCCVHSVCFWSHVTVAGRVLFIELAQPDLWGLSCSSKILFFLFGSVFLCFVREKAQPEGILLLHVCS